MPPLDRHAVPRELVVGREAGCEVSARARARRTGMRALGELAVDRLLLERVEARALAMSARWPLDPTEPVDEGDPRRRQSSGRGTKHAEGNWSDVAPCDGRSQDAERPRENRPSRRACTEAARRISVGSARAQEDTHMHRRPRRGGR